MQKGERICVIKCMRFHECYIHLASVSFSFEEAALNHTTEGNKISQHLGTTWKQICPHKPSDENPAQVNTLTVVLQRIPLSHAWAPGSYHFKVMWFYFIIFKIFWPCYAAHGIFIPWAGIEPRPPALEAWNLNHWTVRQVTNMLVSWPMKTVR